MNEAHISKICVLIYQASRRHRKNTFFAPALSHTFNFPFTVSEGGTTQVRFLTPILYELDGPGIESRWRRDFPHPSTPALGLTQPPKQGVSGLSRR